MTTYFCKCGRQVKKATDADNTGNRDTEGCVGCPYLLPWGPFVWDEVQKACTQDIKGQECRMSPAISYTTTYHGQANDKRTLHIVSLDLDFLDQVQAWICDNAADTLSAGFSRGSIRAVDFRDQGRYSLSISCAQNKKGMAAKAALLDRFFTAGRVRRDMTPAQEKAHILAVIKKGREQAQRKDTTMKKQNDRCPLQQECERTCKMIGHERDCDYYVNNRHGTGGIPDQDKILTAEERKKVREWEEQYLASLSDEPSDPVTYQNEYGTLFAVRNHKGVPALMCKAKGADSWTLSGVLAAVQGEAYTASDLQEELDEYARAHSWKKAAPEQAKADFSPCESCRCPDCDDDACPQAHCDKSDKGLGCIAPDGLCPPPNPTDAAPASRADAGAAEQSPSVAGPASLEAPLSASSAFDYSGMDVPTRDTLRWAEKEIRDSRRDYIARLAQAVSIAHGALCPGVVQNLDNSKHGNRGEETFTNWCASVGIKRSTAYNLLQVQALLSGSTTEEQATLEAASPSLLYAAAKPSAPAELVQAVKDGDITTNKQYQEALAEIRARDAKITDLLEMSEAADRRADKAEQAAKDTARERDTALRRAAEAEKQRDGARDALAAAKLRGDKLKAENDALKAHPIEAQVVDEEEIDRRAQARSDELTAPLREELEALRARHPADLEEAEQAIRDAYDSAVYTGRVIESAWRSLCPLLPRMDADRRELALNQIVKIISTIQGECIQCL